MAPIVGINGVGTGYTATEQVRESWLGALNRGVGSAVGRTVHPEEMDCVLISDLLKWTARPTTGRFGPREFLTQVAAYVLDGDVKDRVHQRIAEQIKPDTRIVLAHSLGSVGAYEVLCGLPEHGVEVLVTFGSPLGFRRSIFDRLRAARSEGRRAWPGGLIRWVNLADRNDPIAPVKALGPLFGTGEQIEDRIARNGVRVHSARSYLSNSELTTAMADFWLDADFRDAARKVG